MVAFVSEAVALEEERKLMTQQAVKTEGQDPAVGERPRPRVNRRQFIGRSAGTALAVGGVGSLIAACGGGSGNGDGGEVVVLTWGGAYIGPEVARGLKEKTGITLRPVAGESDSDFFTKVKAGGGSQYDVVIANVGFAKAYEQAGLIEPLAVADFTSTKDLYPQFTEDTRFPNVLGNGKVLSFPNLWGSYAMCWNTEVDYQPSEPYSWKALWEAPRGRVQFHGNTSEVIVYAALAYGIPADRVFSLTGSELEQVEEYLIELKPFFLSASDETSQNGFRTQKAWIGSIFGLASDLLINERAGKRVTAAAIPEEGTFGALDGLQLVKGAKNRENALEFIDFFASHENQLEQWALNKYAPSNRRTVEAILRKGGEDATLIEALRADKPDIAASMIEIREPDDSAAWDAAWDRIRAA